MSANGNSPIANPSECTWYTRCYCEENVWKLCEYVRAKAPELVDDLRVVFISNVSKAVPLWQQRARKAEDEPVLWDYHVIAVLRNRNGHFSVYDLDTFLPFPCAFDTYLKETFRPGFALKPQYQHKLKVVSARDYLQHFASDRSHMRKEDGSWLALPPNYPCISTAECTMNLDEYINMDSNVGAVYTLSSFIEHFKSTAE